jgi:hypothetical protein
MELIAGHRHAGHAIIRSFPRQKAAGRPNALWVADFTYLAPFFEKAKAGGILVVGEIHERWMPAWGARSRWPLPRQLVASS